MPKHYSENGGYGYHLHVSIIWGIYWKLQMLCSFNWLKVKVLLIWNLTCHWPISRGQIQILQTAASGETYDGFEAQPPCVVKRKAYEFSREMPSVLQLESLSASNVLTDIFWDGSPKLQDIALYFFPSKQTEKSASTSYLDDLFCFFLVPA